MKDLIGCPVRCLAKNECPGHMGAIISFDFVFPVTVSVQIVAQCVRVMN